MSCSNNAAHQLCDAFTRDEHVLLSQLIKEELE